MRGDICPYDHGNDPVIVDDVNLKNVLSFPGEILHIDGNYIFLAIRTG